MSRGRLAVKARTMLSDEQWKTIAPLLPGKKNDPGRTGLNNRMSLEGMLWIVRTGTPWRDLPARFGKWNSVHRRFRRWARSGVFQKAFAGLGKRDLRTIMVDGSFAKLHQHGAGARRNGLTPRESSAKQNIGRSRGGLTTKVIAVIDAVGRPVRFTFHPGNRHEGPLLLDAIEGLDIGELIADKAYDSKRLRSALASRGITVNIPSTSRRTEPFWHDPARYAKRHLVENLFADLKQFRGVATRYCKLTNSYSALVHLAAWVLDTRPSRR